MGTAALETGYWTLPWPHTGHPPPPRLVPDLGPGEVAGGANIWGSIQCPVPSMQPGQCVPLCQYAVQCCLVTAINSVLGSAACAAACVVTAATRISPRERAENTAARPHTGPVAEITSNYNICHLI